MTAIKIQNELEEQGYDITGVVAWSQRGEFMVRGYRSDDLPDTVLGHTPIDDPTLSGQS